jgi:hypothetical protein
MFHLKTNKQTNKKTQNQKEAWALKTAATSISRQGGQMT